MRSDGAVKGLAEAINHLIPPLAEYATSFSTWDAIDKLDESELDELAWELNITWYDSGADIETKRELVKTSDLVRSRLGTVWAVEEVVRAYFGEAAVKEWFNYGGEPGHFKIFAVNRSPPRKMIHSFIELLNNVKRVGIWLEEFNILMDFENYSKSIGAVIHDKAKTRLKIAPIDTTKPFRYTEYTGGEIVSYAATIAPIAAINSKKTFERRIKHVGTYFSADQAQQIFNIKQTPIDTLKRLNSIKHLGAARYINTVAKPLRLLAFDAHSENFNTAKHTGTSGAANITHADMRLLGYDESTITFNSLNQNAGAINSAELGTTAFCIVAVNTKKQFQAINKRAGITCNINAAITSMRLLAFNAHSENFSAAKHAGTSGAAILSKTSMRLLSFDAQTQELTQPKRAGSAMTQYYQKQTFQQL
jgi:phage tail P2-like protein